MLSQIAKSAALQIAHQDKIEQEWHNAKGCVETAQWMLDCAAGTPMENDMAEVLEGAKRTEREAYARVQSISAESRSLFNHYANKLK